MPQECSEDAKGQARKARIAAAFSARAEGYDEAAAVQGQVARRLAGRIAASGAQPRDILEIGCGTGFLSARLAEMFPQAGLLLTDIAPAMLESCRVRMGARASYAVLDGEHPEGISQNFDLIVSSLAMQWFGDLPAGLARLCRLLRPGGRLVFATLGAGSFAEWRALHAGLGLRCGTPDYPDAEHFPFPAGVEGRLAEERLVRQYANGREFVRSLKAIGAREPGAGYRPLSAGKFRRVLAAAEGGFPVTYHILYGEILQRSR